MAIEGIENTTFQSYAQCICFLFPDSNDVISHASLGMISYFRTFKLKVRRMHLSEFLSCDLFESILEYYRLSEL